MAQLVKNPPATQETQGTRVQSLGWEDPLEEENGNPLQYSCLKKIPWTKMPGRLQSVGSHKGHMTEQLTFARAPLLRVGHGPWGRSWRRFSGPETAPPWSTPVSQSASELTVRRGLPRLVERETAPGWRDPLAPREALEGAGELLI